MHKVSSKLILTATINLDCDIDQFMEENFKVSSKPVDSGRWNTQENYLWKSQTKANRELSRSWPFHIILNRKVEPVNRGYAEQAFSNQ